MDSPVPSIGTTFRWRALPTWLLFLVSGACAVEEGEAPRHVVLVSLDTTRADHLGCHGDTRGLTPSIDRFAREAILFRKAFTAAPTTLAAHTSILTGRYPRSHGVVRNGFQVHPSNVLLAERLAQAGFRTAAFIGSYALHSTFGMQQGFETYDERFDLLVADGGHLDQNQRRAERVTDAVLEHLDREATGADRWFLFVHYFDAHSPYDSRRDPDAASGTSQGEALGSPEDLALAVRLHHEETLGRSIPRVLETGLTRRLLERSRGKPLGRDLERAASYAQEIAYLDEHVGRLFEGLRERGILEDAITVLTGDHGESFWEHADTWNHGLCVYQSTVHIPMLLRLPDGAEAGGHLRGSVVDRPVSSVDLVPTILAQLRLEAGRELEGMDLLGPAPSGRLIFTEATQPRARRHEQQTWGNAQKAKAVMDGRWKYVWTPYLEYEELFDLSADPDERSNLLAGAPSPESSKQRTRLRGELEAWCRAGVPLASEFNPEGAADVVQRLGELGYGGSDED